MADFVITNATIVLADAIVEGGSVLIRDGLIVEVQSSTSLYTADGVDVLDARGAYLLPGLIDLHNDALEFEINPRPRVDLPIPFALNCLEFRLLASGITTEFHAISFIERPGAARSVSNARERSAFIAALETSGSPRAIEHHVQHRINVRDRAALEVVLSSLDALNVRFASLNDHTPGQGQYRDVTMLAERMKENQAARGPSYGSSDEAELRQRMETAAADAETVPYIYERVRAYAQHAQAYIATHDDHTPEKVDAQCEIGATIAEFPITVETARRARDRGMAIVVGAPNVVRGGSQSGNLAAHELIQEGLADIICADYHAPSLLAAVMKIVRAGMLDLPSAVRMITLNAAQAVGLADRGAIQPGLRADITLMRLDEYGFPVVEAVFSRGQQSYSYGRGALTTPANMGINATVGIGVSYDGD